MRLAMIGLGRMGGNMSERLLRGGHEVVVFDRKPDTVQRYVSLGAVGTTSLGEITTKLRGPRIVWIMVPAGKPVDEMIAAVLPGMSKGDVIIDGGNSNFHDSMRRAAELQTKGIQFVDSGTSGGIWGLANGYCLMIGASPEAFKLCEPIFKTLAPPDGYGHMGPPGAGHYVKMVHHGIEYGALQACAEGYEILHASRDFKLDLHKIAAVWNHGSVVRSWLNELAEIAVEKDGELCELRGCAEESGEGRWTVQEATAIDGGVRVII